MRTAFELVSTILVAGMLLLVPAAVRAEKYKVHDRISVGGEVGEGDVVDLGIDHSGVRLEAISFDEDEASLIVWNRTASKVNLNAGLALFDEGGVLVAAESDDRPLTRSIFSIKSGKQATLKFTFKKFLSHVSEAKQFRLVVAIVETEETMW
jgi:hypothetical protein